MKARILISACLLGRPVRYDGRGLLLEDQLIDVWQAEGRLVPLCPEVAAGFATPRPPAEIVPGYDGAQVWAGRGAILEDTGQDVTEQFRAGAAHAVQVARSNRCAYALLTDGSPSCGSNFIYSGGFDGQKRAGEGVVTAALRAAGIQVFAPSGIEDLAQAIAGQPT